MTRDNSRYNQGMPAVLSSPIAQKRNPRFQRSSEPVAFQLTERDVHILRLVRQARFLRSTHIVQLVGGSDQQILRRLAGLYHAKYLDRPRAQLDFYAADGGSSPMVYALADRGARLLNERDALELPDTDWHQKNREVKRPFLLHTLRIADVHVALTTTTRARLRTTLIDAEALIKKFPMPPTQHDRAFTWSTHVNRNGASLPLSVTPDYAFALASPSVAMRAYLAECDRGTMPIDRADFRQTSITRKYVAYLQGLIEKRHDTQFGWKALRILFISTTPQRVENMRQGLVRATQAPNLRRQFYFATYDAVTNDVLGEIWTDGNGDRHTLI